MKLNLLEMLKNSRNFRIESEKKHLIEENIKQTNDNNKEKLKVSLHSFDNTTSGVNWSNITNGEPTKEESIDNQQLVKSDSKNEVKSNDGDGEDTVNMCFQCNPEDKKSSGYKTMGDEDGLNNTVRRHPMHRNFSPIIFPGSGITACPDIYKDERDIYIKNRMNSQKKKNDFSEKSIDDYMSPGNYDFYKFTYPKIGNTYHYLGVVVPNTDDEWKWIFNYMKNIQLSFKRKFRCNVYLCKSIFPYKGRKAHLIKIESHKQFNILRCRSGLPEILRKIIYDAPNALMDTECYCTEYLQKRKRVFSKVNDEYKPSNEDEEEEEEEEESDFKDQTPKHGGGYNGRVEREDETEEQTTREGTKSSVERIESTQDATQHNVVNVSIDPDPLMVQQRQWTNSSDDKDVLITGKYPSSAQLIIEPKILVHHASDKSTKSEVRFSQQPLLIKNSESETSCGVLGSAIKSLFNKKSSNSK